MEYFTADTHFFDKRMINNFYFAPRDFFTTGAMNAGLVAAWNEVVEPGDTVYHLGDIAVLNLNAAHLRLLFELLCSLHGHIVFIKGNHDHTPLKKYIKKHNFKCRDGQFKFAWHDVGLILKRAGHQLYLTHYPLILGMSKSAINLHGHIHRSAVNHRNNINVGVDSPEKDYLGATAPQFGTPFSLPEVMAMAAGKVKDYEQR